jgi:hypothetical protein
MIKNHNSYIKKIIEMITIFKDFLNENVSKNDMNDFINDFGFLITLNFSQITKMGKDKKSTDELINMMSNLRKPIINGMNFTDIIKDLNIIYTNPKLLSEFLNKIREYLIYIEPRIINFVIDNSYKQIWLNKIVELKKRYSNIIKNL